jgi:hypothetical protein
MGKGQPGKGASKKLGITKEKSQEGQREEPSQICQQSGIVQGQDRPMDCPQS